MQNGIFYRLECGNAIASGLYKASEFKDDTDAIETACSYEATLTKEEYRDGERISYELLYSLERG